MCACVSHSLFKDCGIGERGRVCGWLILCSGWRLFVALFVIGWLLVVCSLSARCWLLVVTIRESVDGRSATRTFNLLKYDYCNNFS